MQELRCGNCGQDKFEVEMGICHCLNCGAVVNNEIAAAIRLELEEDSNDAS